MELEKVKQIISEQLNIAVSTIDENTSFVDDLGADSLDVFQIIMALEEEFELEISNEEAEKLSTVGDTVKYIKKNLNND